VIDGLRRYEVPVMSVTGSTADDVVDAVSELAAVA
jgi:hypothetical protein